MLVILLVLCMILPLPVSAAGSGMGELEPYGVQLIQYYLHHQEAAADVIWDITRQMKELDPKQGAAWEKIMFDWSWINSEMVVNEAVLPDGLPQDDSLCIVVMGFGLKPDGSIRPELEDRLMVALTSAIKYPNAWVLVTGGQTGAVDGVTEAGQMAAWLRKNGLEDSRIIQEKQSLSTTANAVNCYKLLTRSYPSVSKIAVISSDYHITQSCALFAAMSNYQAGYKGGRRLELVGNAVCDTGTEWDSLAQQAWGMSLIMNLPYEDNTKAPELYPVERPVEPIAGPLETAAQENWPRFEEQPSEEEVQAEPEAAEETPKRRSYAFPAALGIFLLIVLWVLIPKKPRKRNRRERPKMNWDVE